MRCGVRSLCADSRLRSDRRRSHDRPPRFRRLALSAQCGSPSASGAPLDAGHGGQFELAPEIPYHVRRRYLPSTNVLETTFLTDRGTVRVTDALTLPLSGLGPFRELTRRVETISGRAPLRWRVEPRFGYAAWPARLEFRGRIPVFTARGDAVALCSWDAETPRCEGTSIKATFIRPEPVDRAVRLARAGHAPGR